MRKRLGSDAGNQRAMEDDVWLDAQLDRAYPGGRMSDFSRYDSMEVLGHGSFAQVTLMRDSETGQHVVAKQIRVEGLARKEQKQLATEVAVQAQLRHPHIITLFGFHHAQLGQLSLVMQYAEGGTLDQLIENSIQLQWQLSVPDVRLWVGQLASALQYMHSRHVLHRDLSCQNVFLDSDGDMIVGDFGLSYKLAGHNSMAPGGGGSSGHSGGHSGSFRRKNRGFFRDDGASDDPVPQFLVKTMCGTPSFMSPELINGEQYGTPNDVWAFGVIVFEMITLKVCDPPSTHPLHTPSPHSCYALPRLPRCAFPRFTSPPPPLVPPPSFAHHHLPRPILPSSPPPHSLLPPPSHAPSSCPSPLRVLPA